MAIRRSFGDDATDREMGFADDSPFTSPRMNPPTGAGTGNFDEFGNEIPNFAGDPNFPVPFVDYQPDELAGNTAPPREVFGGQQPRTPVASTAPPSDPMADILAMLPQGVEAQSSEASGMGAGSTPGLSREPVTSVARQQPPAMAGGEMGMGGAQAPRRNTFESPSALFAGGKPGAALGRTGGFSLPGQSQGPPAATKQMLELLKQLQGIGV